MTSQPSLPGAQARRILLFGPQALSHHSGYFGRMRSQIVGNAGNDWILDTVEDLPTYWGDLTTRLPKLRRMNGESNLEELRQWLKEDSNKILSPQLPNMVLGPLVVLSQLTEYTRFLDETDRKGDASFNLPKNASATGFCLGILSAVVVACSHTRAQFRQNGAAAIRLSAVIGALVDAQDREDPSGQSVSLAAAWKTEHDSTILHNILRDFPNTYRAVSYDHNRSTLTTTRGHAETLKARLAEVGITANEIDLYGRFHAQLHKEDFNLLLEFCNENPGFQFPSSSSLAFPIHLSPNDELRCKPNVKGLHEESLRAILLDHSNWIETVEAATQSQPDNATIDVFCFGPERCVPPSLLKIRQLRVTHVGELSDDPNRIGDNDVAVVGMACNLGGAPDLEHFWDILMSGESQHKEVPTDRFGFETVFRPDPDKNRKWFGNFIDDYDAFDHKFFKKTPREVVSMDPQQRLLLQSAYQAVAQSGYFQRPVGAQDRRIGCYIGVCATDYENNIAHHAPNAFSATGNLRSFIAGKISHYFGWTGPGLTIDTACSASAVAIHQACRAILEGDCSAALAGGTNFISSPLWFQNLAAASFLSPTGQCKPFDSKADGYCRGEAIATVFLKKMSQAIADGNQIFGVISGTAVYQNENCTPIFVPNAPSLSSLFETVIDKSGLTPNQISYVEAHGTGTPVGDPAEYESIRSIFAVGAKGRDATSRPVQFGSVKGLVGHTEGSSGAVSLIKVLLMLNKHYVPPQASFDSMNPSIHRLPSDLMEISREARPWQADFMAALINNYGASGSNASMIVKQRPRLAYQRAAVASSESASWWKLPFWISGTDDASIRAYAKRLRQFVARNRSSGIGLHDISFNLARQSNWSLPHGIIFSSRSLEEFDQTLASLETSHADSLALPAPRLVILCFGGQISMSVGLDQAVYENNSILRKHLDRCDQVCQSIGASSIYPGIFQRDPITDVSVLQPILFAMQYSCAMSWIESGVQPVAVIGHSFGELTALCVSGVLNLADSLSMVFGRAQVIKHSWTSDRGAMMAVEADLNDAQELVAATNGHATIACYNGPRSFTLAGATEAIDALQQTITNRQNGSMIKYKRLSVSHAFHSPLIDKIKPELLKLCQDLHFDQPRIQLEMATENQTMARLSKAYVADHMRDAVYFYHAAQRLHNQYPGALWLEAGSNSTITNMAGKALGGPKDNTFVPVNITSGQAMQQLTETTLTLWKAGVRAQFWPHSKLQSYEYATLLLPPYQFAKHRHWLEFKPPPTQIISANVEVVNNTQDLPYTFCGYQDEKKERPSFRINTMAKRYQDIVAGHVIARTAPICPATLQIDLAVEAIMSIRPDLDRAKLEPQIRDVSNQAPICIDPARLVYLEYEPVSTSPLAWSFKIFSNTTQKVTSVTTHVIGQIYFHSRDNAHYRADFDRLARLVTHERCLDLLHSHDADDVIQGRSIYKVFSDVVDYSPAFFGLQKLVGRGSESAGRVVRVPNRETWLDPLLGDCFSQVGGIWVNCMANQDPQDMFIANGFEQWTKSPHLHKQSDSATEHTWNVLVHHKRVPTGNAFVTDIFVFDQDTGALVEVILGINYAKVAKLSMSKLLARLSPGALPMSAIEDSSVVAHPPALNPAKEGALPASPNEADINSQGTDSPQQCHRDILDKLKAVLADISGLETTEIKDDTNLVDIGIDSLMGMEMAREIETTFHCTLDTNELMDVFDLSSLLGCLHSALGVSNGDAEHDSEPSYSDSRDSRESHPTTTESSVSSGADTPFLSKEMTPSPIKITSAVTNATHIPAQLELPLSTVLGAFQESKARTDHFIEDHRCSGYLHKVNPRQTNLCVALTIEAFKALGCDLTVAAPGQELRRVPHVPQHARLCDYLYQMLEETRIIDMDDDRIVRTAIPAPSKTSEAILQDLLHEFPDHYFANQLTQWTGSHIAEILSGKADGIKLIFGNATGRDLVAVLYGDSLLNKLSYQQMSDFFQRLLAKITKSEWTGGTLNILEMGAGTGGTTKWLVPMLARLGFPVQYTFTDLSASFVAAARKRFKEYQFMRFAVHDIEQPPSPDLMGTQHIVIASNAIHATHSLDNSTRNIHKFLRPDGFLMMIEMTETLYWVDIIFGILEGWWLFDDGRKHAIANERHWEQILHSAGFGHVDWTDGQSPEVDIQKIFIAMASGPKLDLLPPSTSTTLAVAPAPNIASRQEAIDRYVDTATKGLSIPTSLPINDTNARSSILKSVLVTGATGNLGCHLVMHLASQPDIQHVYCFNRRNNVDATTRQIQALELKGIIADAPTISKLKVLEGDAAKPLLGLTQEQYDELVDNVTHIVHNAWPMSGKMPLKAFESQFTALRNLIDLAASVSARRPAGQMLTFQFISSIATVGHYPLVHGTPDIPEVHTGVECVLPNGYGDAKFVCERILDETLHRHPERFRTMAVRLGQIAGSSASGYWNHMEHFSFLVKSAQTLRALPDLDGPVSWTPVNDVAATCSDLLFYEGQPHAFYHIDNRLEQSWKEMILVLADALTIPRQRVVPFKEWIRRVRAFPGLEEWDNPAAKLVDFLEQNFERMSCGGVLLETKHTCEHSAALRYVRDNGVENGVVKKYVQAWRESGFLR